MEAQLSPTVERILQQAMRPHQFLNIGQLMRGLLEDDEALPAQLLASHGLPFDVARAELAHHDRTLTYSAIMQEARDISRERDDYPDITSDTLLLAVLRTDPALSRQLQIAGLQFDRLNDTLLPTLPPLPEPELVLRDDTEQMALGRILDVTANRVRESLRILDDYARFVLEDRFLTAQLKSLRHDFVEVMATFPESQLLEARETLRDVGTTIETASESARRNLAHVAQVNLKRVQEALRSLEEFGKIADSDVGRRFERLRYQTYTLEQALVLGSRSRERLQDARLYVLLTASQCQASMEWTIEQAAAGGATLFQLREKALDDRRLLARAREVRHWTLRANALFIMNDRPDIARLANADGVHLGQDDMPVKEARQIMGVDAIIGVSTHNLEQLQQAILDGANYIGIGPAFPTSTKPDITIAGLDYLRTASEATSLPAFAIGGITPENIDAVMATGVKRVAVSSVIARAEEPVQVAAALRRALIGFAEDVIRPSE